MAAVLTFTCCAAARAETLCGANADVAPETVVVVGLSTGDTVVARFVACEDAGAVLEHPLFGRIVVADDTITQVVAGKPGEDLFVDVNVSRTPTDAATAAEAATREQVEQAEVAAEAEAPEAPEAAASAWQSQAEFGLNGSEGNSERLSARLGARTKLTTERRELTLDGLYTRSEEAGDSGSKETTENKALGKANHDWLFPGSPWRYFLGGTIEYDEFQDYDLRLAASTGPAYEFISTDKTTLIGRTGLGVSHKIGGDDEDYVFEAVAGYDFEHKFSERQKLVSTGRLYPSLSDGGEYRALLGVAYDIAVDSPLDLTVRLGIEDRFDSTIEDVITYDTSVTPPVEISREEFDKNDLDYYAALIWNF
jgi:putative salt-induced outer membrane protein YdiY